MDVTDILLSYNASFEQESLLDLRLRRLRHELGQTAITEIETRREILRETADVQRLLGEEQAKRRGLAARIAELRAGEAA